MRVAAPLAALLLAEASCAPAARPLVAPAEASASARREIAAVLDGWHAAAARADEDAYFAQLAPDAIFLGTDATERWSVPAFRAYAHPRFAAGKAWAFRAVRRDIDVADGGAVAWFDEDLETKNLGPARGSGVVVERGGRWLIRQYNLALTVPNERFDQVKRAAAGEAPCAQPPRSDGPPKP